MAIPQGQSYQLKFFIGSSSAIGSWTGISGLVFGTTSGAVIRIQKPGGSKTEISYAAQLDLGEGDYEVTLSSSEMDLGLAAGAVGELTVYIQVPSTGFGVRLSLDVENKVAAPSSGAIASAVDAILADNFAALPTAGSIATAVGAPTANQVRDAVWAQLSDGSPVLQRLTAAIALLLNKAQLPGEDGGAIVVRDAADTKDRIVAAITSGGARTVTSVDGA